MAAGTALLGWLMTQWFADTDAGVVAVVLAVVLVAAWGGARWLGKRRRGEREGGFQEASLALVGLLLGFAFSMSLSKHEARRQMVVTDSNAIADFATCA